MYLLKIENFEAKMSDPGDIGFWVTNETRDKETAAQAVEWCRTAKSGDVHTYESGGIRIELGKE